MNGEELAEGVYGFETNGVVNWYLVEDGDRLAAIDAGFSSSWNEYEDFVKRHNRNISDLEAVVLTHAHVDHFGFAARARKEAGARIYAHHEEASLVRNPFRPIKSERLPIFYMRYGATRRLMLEMTKAGFRTPGVKQFEEVQDGETVLERVPGKPKMVFTPGHTHGHCAIHLEERGVVFPGDAWVTRDPYTGREGPRLVARSATNNVEQNLKSLELLEKIDAPLALTGHGAPWRESAADGAREARAAGAA
jgi:glyoxylase-like metal-dependent hydrolase (beta-lactamase superfamily II)